VGELRGDRILTLQGQLLEDGIRTSIRIICSVLGYNRSNVYYAPKAKPKKAIPPDPQLVEAIRDVIERFPEYGTRRITVVLRRERKMIINRKRSTGSSRSRAGSVGSAPMAIGPGRRE